MTQNLNDADAALLATDPLRFCAVCWPEMKLYEKQRDVLLSVRDNVETFVPAANQTGKSRIAAIVALWFFTSRTPARVITSSSSETQLNSILWSEIQHLMQTSRFPMPFVAKSLLLRKLKKPDTQETEPLDYIIGHVTNQVENFQGHHLSNDKPRVLAIFDEASGVPDEFFDAADSWAHRKLVIGNPLSTTNFFYRLCKRGDLPDPAGEAKLLRKIIRIDGLDSPNVQLGRRWKEEGKPGQPPVLIPGLLTYGEYLRREQEWDVVKRTTRLHGRFYEGDQALLFPSAWLNKAMDRQRWEEICAQPRRVEAMGIDVAAGGRDDSCWTLVDHAGVIQQIVQDTPNTMHIVGQTIQLMQQHSITAARVAIDAGGGGKQIADRLHEQGYYVQIVGFGESADAKQTYRNRRAEMYGRLREYLNPDREEGCFALSPNAHELRAELAALPLQYDSEGRLLLPPKEPRADRRNGELSLRQLLGRSPDRADSLALAVWVLRAPGACWSPDYPLACSGGADDPAVNPLTSEELADAHPLLRDLILHSGSDYGPWE